MVKLINAKLQYVSHFHVSVTQQINFLRILLIVIFSSMLVWNLSVMSIIIKRYICENRLVGIVVYQPESAQLLQMGLFIVCKNLVKNSFI